MPSKRTLSYLGFWVLILPWIGFSWYVKSILFSLTGILLLYIGNRMYHVSKHHKETNEPIIKPEHVNNFVPSEQLVTSYPETNNQINNENGYDATVIRKPRGRKPKIFS